MDKTLLLPNNQIRITKSNNPIIDINDEGMGLNRDRNPDRDWPELKRTLIKDYSTIVDFTPEFKLQVLEDLAYTYGNHTVTFNFKLKEFGLIPS